MAAVGEGLILVGAIFCALAAIGIVRFPDVYTRLHAASKAGPVGLGLILLGAGIASGDFAILARCMFGLVFLILTAPLSGHLLARASLRSGTAPAKTTSIDELTDNT